MFTKRPLVNVENAQKVARRRLPNSIYDFIIGDTEHGLTTQNNLSAIHNLTFRPKAGVAFEKRQLKTTVLGSEMSMPLALAPAGALRLARRHAYIQSAAAAGKAGIAIGVSTASTDSIDDIKRATDGPVWYQIYMAGGMASVEVAIERAKRAGCTALIVTLDTAMPGYRDAQLLGPQFPLKLSVGSILRFAPQCLTKPAWTFDYLREGLEFQASNVRLSMDGPPLRMTDINMYAHPPTWADFEHIKKLFGGPVAAKGIMRVDDAETALEHGADAIIVSNHGGYQIDSAPGTLQVLPEIVDAVGHRTEILVDSGFRRGQDVVKALALGAKAVLIGRAYAWPLAARGEEGVSEILSRFRDEIDRTLANLGCADVRGLDRSYLNLGTYGGGRRASLLADGG